MSTQYLRCNGCGALTTTTGQYRLGALHDCATQGAWQLVPSGTVTILCDCMNFDVASPHGYRVLDPAAPDYQSTIDNALRNNKGSRAYEVDRSVWEAFVVAADRYLALDRAIQDSPGYYVSWHARLHRGGEILSERELQRFGRG